MKIKWTLLGILMLMVVVNATAQVNISGHVAYVCNADNGTGNVTFYSNAFTGQPQNYTVRIGNDPDPLLNPVIFSGTVSNSNFTFSQSTNLTVGQRVYISVSSGSFSDIKSFTVSRFDTPDPPTITPLSAEICGSGSQLLTASGGSGTYQWYKDGSPVTGFGNTYTATAAGSYTVSEENYCGTSSVSNAATVTVKTIPTKPSITAPPMPLCDGASGTLTAVGDATNTFTWYRNGNPTGQTGISISVSTAGNYTVIESNTCGSSPTSDAVVVTTLNKPAAPTVTPAGPILLCDGQTTTLTANGTGGTYTWNTSATGNTLLVGSAGSYSVTESNACGASASSNVVTVTTGITPTQPSTPSISPVGPILLCDGASTTLTASGGSGSYIWSTGATTSSITVSAAGNYFAYSPGTSNACGTAPNSANSNVVVVTTLNKPVAPSVTPAGPILLCNGNTATLTANGTGGNYNWNTGATTNSIVVASAGSYSVTESNACGASPSSNVVVVTTGNLPTKPILSPTGTIVLCNGNSVTITTNPSSGGVIRWNTGATGNSITVSAAGTYFAWENNNCGDGPNSDAVTIVTLSNPVVNAISGANEVCHGSTTTFTNTTPGGTWSSGDNSIATVDASGIVTGVAVGTTTINYSVSNVCGTTIVSKSITVRPRTVLPAIGGLNGVCRGKTITLTNAQSGGTWSSSDASIATINSAGLVTGVNPGSVTITYTYVNVYNCVSTVTKTVTVWALPTIGVTATVNATSAIFTATGASTYAWSSGENTAVITKPMSSTATYTVTGTDGNGCDNTAQYAVNSTPNTGATSINSTLGTDFCNGSTATLTATAGDSYYWSTGATTQSITVGTSGTYTVFVARNATSIVEVANIVVTVSANTVGGTVSMDAAVCSGSNNGTLNLSSHIGDILRWEYSENSGGTWTTLANTTTQQTYLNITVTTQYRAVIKSGTCPQQYSSVATITVKPTPDVNTVTNQVLCHNDASTAITFSGSVPGTQFNWVNNTPSIGLAASGLGDIASFTATNTGNSPVTATITVTPTAAGCPGSSTSFTIRVSPTPNVAAVASQVRCAGELTNTINLSGTVIGTQFNWTNSNATIGLPASGMGSVISSFATINTGNNPVEGIITVTASANGCTMVSQPETKAIAPNLPVAGVGSNGNKYTLRAGTTTLAVYNKDASAITSTDVAQVLVSLVNGGTQSHGYSATSSGDVISLIAPAGSGSSLNGTAASLTWEGVVTITANSSFAGGIDGRGAVFGIRVNPIPNMTALSNQIVCNNDFTSQVNMTSPVTGTLFNWTNDVVSIGLPSIGTGNIASFQAINTSNAPVTATIRVTPTANGCAGPVRTFTIRVNPTPGINPVSNQVLCNNTFTNAVSFTGAVAGTVYTWTNTTPSIGLAASGTGNIASFRSLNSSAAPVVATVAVSASANGCTVTSTPEIRAVSGNMTVSFIGEDGSIHRVRVGSTIIAEYTKLATDLTTTDIATALVNQVNAGTGAHGYTAQNTGSIIRLTAPVGSGSGANGTQAFVAWTGSYSITSSTTFNGGIDGSGTVFKITVNPTPNVNPVVNQVVCNNASTALISLTGLVSGTTYTWSNNTPSIGLGVTGAGDITPFSATNLGTSPVTATIQVVPTANGCTGSTISMTIRVNPTPTANAVSNLILCNRDNTGNINFSGAVTGTTIAWTNTTTSIGLAASGTGNISSFMATNVSNDPVTATIRITPTANSCTGPVTTFTIRVNPTPTVTPQVNQVVCNGASTTAIYFTGPVAGSTFDWTNELTSIGLAAAGTGNISQFAAINSGTAPVTANIRIVPTANGCIGTPSGFTIRVNPTPNVVAVTNQVLCNKDLTQKVVFNGSVAGTTYTWTNDETYIGLGASGTGDINTFSGRNDSIIPITSTIRVTPSANSCTGSVVSFTIRVNPTPSVNQWGNIVVCNDATIGTMAFNGPVTGTTYSWRNTLPAIGIPASGTGSIAPFRAINDTIMPIYDSVYVIPTANNCVGKEMNYTIRVNPTPKLSTTLTPAAICDSTGFVYIPMSRVAGASFSWSRAAIPGIANPAATGTGNISEVLVNNSDDDITVTYTITITANGCSYIQQVQVVVRPTPMLTMRFPPWRSKLKEVGRFFPASPSTIFSSKNFAA
ncbi:MAG: Ig-like domain-containing protein [Sediminibacterium sp. Gen4]|jgi:hypothetical protein|uniref:beta strand repeat-containing protein n=1 Tax=Sediminibacterium sp. Gen4 TaxID=2736285 RepID=UPI0015BB834C|nr:PKD-like domain-containing protein [Sediminibacterium sp. Gen4]MBW0162175.1 Ig-like domain-containing protein [Sediminibacterium sp.]NWK66525.1 Ig-like domain-containing protein [Sediminibacterium sp. Gen4]